MLWCMNWEESPGFSHGEDVKADSLRTDVLERLKRIALNIAYDDDVFEIARPKEFNFDSREAQMLVDDITADAKQILRLGCARQFALDTAFLDFSPEINVFFRIFSEGDSVILKTDDGKEFFAYITGIEEIYPSELDDTFEFEKADFLGEVSENDSENTPDEDPVNIRLWFFDDLAGKVDACLVSHIIRAQIFSPDDVPDDEDDLDGIIAELEELDEDNENDYGD